jgi:hypothetical protein
VGNVFGVAYDSQIDMSYHQSKHLLDAIKESSLLATIFDLSTKKSKRQQQSMN